MLALAVLSVVVTLALMVFTAIRTSDLPSLSFYNELISHDVDEGLHRDFTCLLYDILRGKLD